MRKESNTNEETEYVSLTTYTSNFFFEPLENKIDIGNINYVATISFFLKTYYKKNIQSYVYHKEVVIDSKQKFLFILKDDLVISDKFEDNHYENYSEFVNYTPINQCLEYKNV